MIDSAPEVVPLVLNLHEDLVQMPSPVAGLHALNPSLPDLRSQQLSEGMPPEPHRLVADLDTAFAEEVLDIPQRKREADIEHHRPADDLGAGFERLERAVFGYEGTVGQLAARLKQSSSDKTIPSELKTCADPQNGLGSLSPSVQVSV